MNHELWHEVKLLKEEGFSARAAAKRLGVSRRAVRRAFASEEFSPFQRRNGRPSILDSYRGFILAKLEAYPELTAQRIFGILSTMGYPGKYGAVKEYVRTLRPLIATASQREMLAPVECENPLENEPASEPSSAGKLDEPKAKTLAAMFVELELCSPETFSSPVPQASVPVRPKENVIRVVCGETLFELPPGFDGNEFKRALLALKEAS